MVLWVTAFRAQLPAVIELVLRARPSTLDHFAFYRLKQSGIASTNGIEVGRLLRGLMSNLQAIAWDTGEVMDVAKEAMSHGAEPTDIWQLLRTWFGWVAREVMNSGFSRAAALQARDGQAELFLAVVI